MPPVWRAAAIPSPAAATTAQSSRPSGGAPTTHRLARASQDAPGSRGVEPSAAATDPRAGSRRKSRYVKETGPVVRAASTTAFQVPGAGRSSDRPSRAPGPTRARRPSQAFPVQSKR